MIIKQQSLPKGRLCYHYKVQYGSLSILITCILKCGGLITPCLKFLCLKHSRYLLHPYSKACIVLLSILISLTKKMLYMYKILDTSLGFLQNDVSNFYFCRVRRISTTNPCIAFFCLLFFRERKVRRVLLLTCLFDSNCSGSF